MMKLICLALISLLSFNATKSYATTRPGEIKVIDNDKDPDLRMAKFYMNEATPDYISAINQIQKVLRRNPNNTEAQELLDICNKKLEEIRIAQEKKETDDFNTACKIGTTSALASFIEKYPESKYKQQAQDRIDDYQLWSKALVANTKDAYKKYLNDSKNQAYKAEAEQKIIDIESDEEWQNCKNALSIENIEAYLRKFPNSKNDAEAKYNLNILKGEKAFENKDYANAYKHLLLANQYKSLSGLPKKHFYETIDWYKYNEVSKSTDKNKVYSYLTSLSANSPYYDKASNLYAILLAKELNEYSLDPSYDLVLSYAKDKYTQNYVKSYIDISKEKRSKLRHQRRVAAHKRWWKENFKLGIDADIETNVNEASGSDMFYSVGVVARFGSYKHLFNLVFGVKYRWFRVMPEYDSFYNSDDVKWTYFGGAVCIPVSFRFNITDISKRSRLFLGVGGEYGAYVSDFIKDNNYMGKNYVAVWPQIGITSPHFDISMYWKIYAKSPFIKDLSEEYDELKCNNLIGLQMAIFF